ncbi:MAG TPA: exodeoxyribonuclease V subunit alpha [Desulfobacteraceae bacterium]|nr:exodeoxyribonuclease V subunit alpha [Desulfobacteraceae bacterium]
MTPLTTSLFDQCHDQGIFSHLDYYFAKTMAGIFEETSSMILFSAALVSKVLAEGHICLDLSAMAGTPLTDSGDAVDILLLPDLASWIAALSASDMVALETAHGAEPDDPRLAWVRRTPLILDRDNNLYLAKYYDFQHRLARNIHMRISSEKDCTNIDASFIDRGIKRFFGDDAAPETEGQQAAVRQALAKKFLVISGGPGTGKTHITNIICDLLTLWAKQRDQEKPRILALAPTGKAAGRLNDGATIHAVLKPKPVGVGFRHDAQNPLAADVVIVDEASMIDMALMTRLLEAIPEDARVILLGDKNQLSPVQAGAVFTDLCHADTMAGHRVLLTFNFRSRGQSGIENLANAVNENDLATLMRILETDTYDDVGFENLKGKAALIPTIEKYAAGGYTPLVASADLETALNRLDDFRILCAHNRGEGGTLQVNHLCEKVLRTTTGNDISGSLFRQIVMVTRNDYRLGLFNGDTGVVWAGDEKQSAGARQILAVFPDGSKGCRQLRYADLPDHEPAFALTIHKAQGSEYGTVLVVIPDRISPVVTRQLLYTGITRARKKVIIAGRPEVIREAMAMPLQRRSNLEAVLSRLCGRTEPHA